MTDLQFGNACVAEERLVFRDHVYTSALEQIGPVTKNIKSGLIKITSRFKNVLMRSIDAVL